MYYTRVIQKLMQYRHYHDKKKEIPHQTDCFAPSNCSSCICTSNLKKSDLDRKCIRSSFYTPVFRRDVLWYGDVRPSGSPSDSPSVRLSVRPSVRPTLRPSGCPSARFPHFSLTCFDTLSSNFAHDFVLMYYRSSSSVVNLRQF